MNPNYSLAAEMFEASSSRLPLPRSGSGLILISKDQLIRRAGTSICRRQAHLGQERMVGYRFFDYRLVVASLLPSPVLENELAFGRMRMGVRDLLLQAANDEVWILRISQRQLPPPSR